MALPLLIAALTLLSPLEGITLPTYETDDLNGDRRTIPAELPGERTLVFVAFFQNQQPDVNTWVEGMALDMSGDANPAWVELPIVGRQWLLAKGFVNGGMRSGIVAPAMRARTLTIYRSPQDFVEAIGGENLDEVYALVADREGKVYAIERGRFTTDGAARLTAALKGQEE